jgi:3'-phosphoadenosine 5'-phosphosulfate sulfotransferase (PAPS reductase)/FAD synthetase
MRTQHIVNVSGGKDSTACYLLAIERGRPFRAIMADTGNENEMTTEFAARLHERTGGPQVEMVKADFAPQLAARRVYVETVWRAEGVPETIIENALSVLQPTGNPFVDLCVWKGRFPSRRAQFCTEFLKANVVTDQVITPALAVGRVTQWLGVRRDESLNRRHAPLFQRVRCNGQHDMLFYRPLVEWTAAQVFALHAKHGLDPNPLYRLGMGRVGCFPCINASKRELAEIGRRFPEVIEKLRQWEALVGMAAKNGATTFFGSDQIPEGAALAQRLKGQARAWVGRHHPDLEPDTAAYKRALRKRMAEISARAPWPKADEVFRWATTDRGGKQFNLLTEIEADEGLSCSSQYGLCE